MYFSLVPFISFLIIVPAEADSRYYLSSDLGAGFAPKMKVIARSNDRGSVCDEYINPLYTTLDCTGARGPGDKFITRFGNATGILAGGAFGYRLWARVRAELEYFYRNNDYGQTSSTIGANEFSISKFENEFVALERTIDDVTSHNLFANLYFDFKNDSRFTPYMGFGLGVGWADIDYSVYALRNPDAAFILAGAGLPNEDEIRHNLAGTETSVQRELSDALFGYQAIVGLDYDLAEKISLGIKMRWVNFEAFDDDMVMDRVRGHAPNYRLDGSEPAMDFMSTDDIELLTVSLNLKYRF